MAPTIDCGAPTREWMPPSTRLVQALPVAMLLFASCAGIAAASTAVVPKYFVAFDASMTHADVRLCLDHARKDVEFAPDSPRAMRYFSAIRRSTGGPLDSDGSPWQAKNWRAGECLEYTADIGAIADRHDDTGTRYGSNIVTDPQHWLLRTSAQGSTGAEVVLELPEGWSVSAPWRELSRDGKRIRFHIADTPPDWSASLVLGHFAETRVELPGGVLRVATLVEGGDQERLKLVAWLDRVGRALLGAYGRLPLPDVQVWLVSVDNFSYAGRFAAFLRPGAVLGGESARGQGNALQLDVDPRRPQREFLGDWTAVHELSHLLHPYLGDRGSWLGEGLATYYQNVLRARAGLLTPSQAWERLAGGFEESAAGPYANTLEEESAARNHSFLRVYWSGAAYWLNVDMDLRRASAGKVTLDTALSRFSDCCLPSYHEWKPEEFVARLDALLGVHAFSRRYHEFARMKGFPDWRTSFTRLGVRAGEDTVTFDAGAPDTAIRDAIMKARVGEGDRSVAEHE